MKPSLIAAALAASAPAWAQDLPASVVVTGNPLGAKDLATPASVLTGKDLVLRRGSTLGETLDGLPGVSSTYFGPNANRPVIRGQDGDRIRVLGNGGASFDASSLSFDHAVPIDPLVVERVEVLRGPAALSYGGSAVGGVVNAIDNRIPREAVTAVSGAFEGRLGGAAGERAASALVEGGGGALAWHADAFWRRTDDLSVPDFDRPLEDGSSERRNFIANSASRADGGALGGSFVWDAGYVGASVDTYRNDYGIVAEDDITIRMRRDRIALAGELRPRGGFFSALRAQGAGTDYRHQEIEGDGSVGTTFANDGSDARLEAVHRALALGGGQLEGSFGLQYESSDFSALGEEAFVPSTHTRQQSVFVLERWSWGEGGSVSSGLRAEQVRVRSGGDADPEEPQFGPAQERRFSPFSAALGAVMKLDERWQLSANASYTERAPTSYELYANGVHAATGTFERGDTQQALEKGRNLDLGLAWRRGANEVKLGLFAARFSNYILLAATGEPDFVDAEGDAFPVYAFSGVRAELYGLEAEAVWRLLDGPRSLDLDARFDMVRGTDTRNNEPLPRLAPQRATLGLTLGQGGWTARAEVQYAGDQTRVPSTDVATEGWTMVNLSTTYALGLGPSDALLYARLLNVGDTLAYSASSIGSVRPLAPLPGRAFSAGLRVSF
ncbi:MAG: TonB-dependent receptor [Rubrivivax sp.]|nr:TonB-dependent receptor [Betaproteobacteria bacterium]MBP9910561.1 TonB-dependent receptor [Rubrivivax sp.]